MTSYCATSRGRAGALRLLSLFLLPTLLLLPLRPAAAFTSADADTIFKAYHQAFYFVEDGKGYYRKTTEGEKTWFWERAEQAEMILDCYERTTNRSCLTLFSNLFAGFVSDHGRTWEKNEFNDDIMWMVIACARAYQHTGSAEFRDAARRNFDLCFARAWSTNLGGGLWWKIDNRSKNSCVNGPGAIAACLLARACGDASYQAKAERIFQWELATLVDTNTGQVYDNIREGRLDHRAFSYNQGTFVGAANLLGHTNEAKLTADYVMNTMCHDGGLMPRYGQGGDAGGFNGICARWIARFMKDRKLEQTYLAWLQANAQCAWENRRVLDNLSWSRWGQPTPAGPLHSWACSSSVVILQVCPPTGL